MDKDAFQLNIEGAENLVGSNTNKVLIDGALGEGMTGDPIDDLELEMDDSELLILSRQWENKYAPYVGKLKPRQDQNKKYLFGTQTTTGQQGKTTASNLLFESTATFVPQALAKNPEPVVWSDNTEEGKAASNDIKTALQFHGDILCLRKKLGVMVWQWGIYFIAGVKHGWDKDANDIALDIRKPQNLIFDPDGYVDEFGDFSSWLGERIQCTAKELYEKFPDHKEYILLQAGMKDGTMLTYTEWWTDEYCFYTFKEKVLDKHKNQFFNYGGKKKTNHFAKPKKPYTFLSVFSMQEQPHDFTNLIEQNVANQDDVIESDKQVGKNLRHGNNSIVCDDRFFTTETAHQAADALEKGDPILGNPDGIKRIPANPLPNGLLDALQIKKDTLRGIYGTQGIQAQKPDENTTARGMLLNQSHDSTRIGGGIGDALEQVADNIFNWWTQMYYVFYDEPHYAAIMGQAHAIEFTKILLVGEQRHFVVSVSPNSMQPKDEITEMNQAIDLASRGWLDPINLFKKLNYADPMETAKMVTLFRIDPQTYMLNFFPEQAQMMAQQQMAQQQQMAGGQPGQVQGQGPTPLSAEPAQAQLSQVPIQ